MITNDTTAKAFGSTFAFFQPHKTKLKIQKSYQATARQKTKNNTTERTTTDNTVLPKWRQKCYYETFVLNSTVVILLNFSANNPPLRQYPNR